MSLVARGLEAAGIATVVVGSARDIVEEIEAVTLEDVKRVAGEIFTQTNRTVGIIETEDAS